MAGLTGEDGWRAAARVRFLLHRTNPLSLRSVAPGMAGCRCAVAHRHARLERRALLQPGESSGAAVVDSGARSGCSATRKSALAAQQGSAAVNRDGRMAKDAGYRLDALAAAARGATEQDKDESQKDGKTGYRQSRASGNEAVKPADGPEKGAKPRALPHRRRRRDRKNPAEQAATRRTRTSSKSLRRLRLAWRCFASFLLRRECRHSRRITTAFYSTTA